MNRGPVYASRILEEKEAERRKKIHETKRAVSAGRRRGRRQLERRVPLQHARATGIDNSAPPVYAHIVNNSKRRLAQKGECAPRAARHAPPPTLHRAQTECARSSARTTCC